jgi:hypothetical protein
MVEACGVLLTAVTDVAGDGKPYWYKCTVINNAL